MSESLWSSPYTFKDDDAIGAYLLNRYLRDPLNHLYYNGLPQRVRLAHEESLVTAGNAIITTINTSSYNAYYAYQNASANGDAWTQSLRLLPGSSYFEIMYRSHPNGGIVTLALDGIDFLVLDTYTAGDIPFQRRPAYVWIDSGDRMVLTGTVTGKNAASGGYQIQISQMVFTPNSAIEGDY